MVEVHARPIGMPAGGMPLASTSCLHTAAKQPNRGHATWAATTS